MSQLKSYTNKSFGLDLNNLVMGEEPLADDCSNCQLRKDQGLTNRHGFGVRHKDTGGYGLVEYNYVDSDGEEVVEIISLDENLHKVQTGYLTINYAGAFTHAYCSVESISGAIYLKLYTNNILRLNANLGKGFDESSVVTLADLVILINATTGFTASVTGLSTQPAAFLTLYPLTQIVTGGSKLFSYEYLDQIYSPSSLCDLVLGTQNIPTCNHKNRLILTDGSKPKVYDGNAVYFAGLPTPTGNSVAEDGAGNLSGNYSYFITYEFRDYQGLNTEGGYQQLDITVTTKKTLLTLDNITRFEGYQTNAGISVDTRSNTSDTMVLQLDDGSGGEPTLRVGDWATFLNSVSGVLEIYRISAVSGFNVTIEGVPATPTSVTINTGAVVSCGLVINIYKQVADADSTTYLVNTVTNNPFTATQTWQDNLSDADTQAKLIQVLPDFTAIELPDSDYCASYKSVLLLAKDYTVFFSDEVNNGLTTSSFYFNSISNFDATSNLGDKIKALAVSNQVLAIFGRKTIQGVQGNLISGGSGDFGLYPITNHLGTVSWSSIAYVGDYIYFLYDTGVYALYNGQVTQVHQSNNAPLAYSQPINKFFTSIVEKAGENLVLERAVSVNHKQKERLLIYIPSETEDSQFATNNSITICYDYNSEKWFFWRNINMGGGSVQSTLNRQLYWTERRLAQSQQTNLCKMHATNTVADCWDHTDPILWSYTTKWDSLVISNATLGTYKKLLNLRLYQVRTDVSDFDSNPLISVTAYRDYSNDVVLDSFDFQATTVGNSWGFRWGNAFGSWYEPFYNKQFERNNKIRALKLRFEGELRGERLNLSGYEVEWGTESYEARMK